MRSKLPDISTSIFTRMGQMAIDHEAINLSQGFPDFNPPDFLLDSLEGLVRKKVHQYAPMDGLKKLKEKTLEKIEHLYECKCEYDELLITAGATQAIFTSVQAIINRGDEVIIFNPAYDCYAPAVQVAGGLVKRIDLTKEFKIDFNTLKSEITKETKLIILNNPNNPSGSVLTVDEIISLEKIVCDNNLFLISDEVYEHILFDGRRHNSILSFSRLRKRSIVISSFGKTYHSTGWKIGYAIAPNNVMEEIKKIHQFNVFSVNSLAQKALAENIDRWEWYKYLSDFYEKKRDFVLEELHNSNFSFIKTASTYFQVLDYSLISKKNDLQFTEILCKEKGVAMIPLSPFYGRINPNKTIRLCFAKSMETLEEACKILKNI